MPQRLPGDIMTSENTRGTKGDYKILEAVLYKLWQIKAHVEPIGRGSGWSQLFKAPKIMKWLMGTVSIEIYGDLWEGRALVKILNFGQFRSQNNAFLFFEKKLMILL